MSEMKKLVDSVITPLMEENNIPGLAIGVVDENGTYIYTYGFANLNIGEAVTTDTIFDIGSITKVFTSELLALASLQTQLKLDDSVGKYINQWRSDPIDGATLENLATHTSSMPRSLSNKQHTIVTKSQLIQHFSQWIPPYPIGTKFLYSNVGYVVLRYILEDSYHESYNHILSQYLLQPLNMTSTFLCVPNNLKPLISQGYGIDNEPVPFPPIKYENGQPLCSNIKDMTNFLKANLGLMPNLPIRLKNAIELSHIGRFEISSKFYQALGWEVKQHNNTFMVQKNGAVPGFCSNIIFDTNKKFGLVVLVNKTHKVIMAPLCRASNTLMSALGA